MTHKYPLIAAGVAAALAAGYVQAAAPTIAQAESPFASLVIAGSSAAKNAVIGAIENDICGGSANTLLVTSTGGSKNFFALSCDTAVTIGGIPTGSLVTIYYRTEGGSVVGALPIATGHTILKLNLADSSCTGSGLTATCAVTGVTATAGPGDSWTGAVIAATVQLGVTDVEPGQLTGADYPTGYSTTAFGSATTAQMKALTPVKLFQQTFGLAVNTSGRTFSTVNLTKESAANILNGSYSDWHAVPDALTGNPISSVTTGDPITRVDREPGSGTRTSANIYFLGYQCSSTNAISTNGAPNFSTTDELTAANGTPGSIAYTSIDQLQDPHNSTSFTNLVLATINGQAPSNLRSATGAYDYWFEATLVPNSSTSGTSADLSSFLQGDMPKLATAPSEPDINVIPGVGGNVAAVPPTNNGKTGTLEIYVNPYTRGGGSCNVPAEQN
jgi:hypothetical protein